MDFYLSLLTLFGFRILLGLSAYVVILTGQISMAQAGFYAIGAYVAGAATSMMGWPLVVGAMWTLSGYSLKSDFLITLSYHHHSI